MQPSIFPLLFWGYSFMGTGKERLRGLWIKKECTITQSWSAILFLL